MDAEELKAGDGVACTLQMDRSTARAGLHPAAGGTGQDLCSGDMLLEALVGCAGVTLKAVATAMGVVIGKAIITGQGTCDFRGTLGVDRAVPAGFLDIGLSFEIGSPAPREQIVQLIKLTERYCVVYQTLKSPPPVTVQLEA